MDNVNSFLKEVNPICEEYDDVKTTDESFNIFKILGLREENHSNFIAELLKHNGSHGKGDEFLKLFLNLTKIGVLEKFENAEVETEVTIENGRIDILITGKDGAKIVIENKIKDYYNDQVNQLARYRDSCRDATIVYLTLDGREPPPHSTNGKEGTYNYKLSYKEHIIEWLKQCKEKSENLPYLQDIITQYINFSYFLTEQSRRKDMSEEIANVAVESQENVIAAFAIAASSNTIKKKIVLEYFVPAMKNFGDENALEWKIHKGDDCLQPFWGISFSNDLLQRNSIRIHFEFQGTNLNNLGYGLKVESEDIYHNKTELRERIMTYGKVSEPYWIFYDMLYDHWHREELADLVSKNKKPEVIEKCERKIAWLLAMIKD